MGTTTEVVVPDIGDFSDVPVVEVMVNAGDSVKEEDPLITLESDKASMDVPSPHAGVVKELKIGVGDKVSEGSIILTLDVAGKDEGETADSTPAQAAEEGEAPVAENEKEQAPQQAPAEAASSKGAPGGETRLEEVTVPDIGDFSDVPVVDVMVKPGDSVNEEDPLITLESDKASMDVPAPFQGVVKEVHIGVGDKVSEGTRVLSLEVAGAAREHREPEAAPAPAERETAPEPEEREAARKPAPGPETRPSPTAGIPLAEEIIEAKPHATPAVRRLARELGVDTTKVKGTGRKGRILKEDLTRFVKETLTRAEAPAGAGAFALPEMPAVDFFKFGPVETRPLGRIKRLTAVNVHRSWLHVPHVTQHEDADITELEAFRKAQGEEAKKRGVRLTLLAFLMKASVSALETYPTFNASLDRNGENLILKKYFHIGIAVDTPEGLVVPVVRDVDQKGIYDLAEELGKVSAKARDKKLSPGDMQGGCFTISSLGGIGGTAFTPIVNAPEVAILGVSRAAMKPVYQNGEFAPRLMLPLALSYDHRVIDGADAARFTSYLREVLSDIRRLLL
ncbi:MAG: dihydrolipoyllysine-residue acetyltransferase [Gammaproteobacteria bacterium]|nr:dihydrolipoyllysine-residue acetyltransferase [Gammaproteobacteria bacterium]